jgi:hypothetical protein
MLSRTTSSTMTASSASCHARPWQLQRTSLRGPCSATRAATTLVSAPGVRASGTACARCLSTGMQFMRFICRIRRSDLEFFEGGGRAHMAIDTGSIYTIEGAGFPLQGSSSQPRYRAPAAPLFRALGSEHEIRTRIRICERANLKDVDVDVDTHVARGIRGRIDLNLIHDHDDVATYVHVDVRRVHVRTSASS